MVKSNRSLRETPGSQAEFRQDILGRLHPTGKDLSAGTARLQPADKSLSAGTLGRRVRQRAASHGSEPNRRWAMNGNSAPIGIGREPAPGPDSTTQPKNGLTLTDAVKDRNLGPVLNSEHNKSEVTSNPYKLEGLDRVVAILDLLAQSDRSLSLAEICHHMELRKSTAHRALMALERTGLIERAPAHRYRLGLKLYDMGHKAVEQIDLRARVHPHLRKLALRVGEIVHLGVLHNTRVVYIDKIEPINRRVCISSRTGTSNPVYSTSLGKAILAFLPPDEAEKIVSRIHFTTFTSKTLGTKEELVDALERVRRRGYSVDDEEMEIGTRCVGAPILDANRRAIAAVSVSGSASRLAAHCVPGIAEHVMRCSQAISSALIAADKAKR